MNLGRSLGRVKAYNKDKLARMKQLFLITGIDGPG